MHAGYTVCPDRAVAVLTADVPAEALRQTPFSVRHLLQFCTQCPAPRVPIGCAAVHLFHRISDEEPVVACKFELLFNYQNEYFDELVEIEFTRVVGPEGLEPSTNGL